MSTSTVRVRRMRERRREMGMSEFRRMVYPEERKVLESVWQSILEDRVRQGLRPLDDYEPHPHSGMSEFRRWAYSEERETLETIWQSILEERAADGGRSALSTGR